MDQNKKDRLEGAGWRVGTATVEVTRAHAATFEGASRCHTGRDRSDRASQPAPCRRGRPRARAEPSSRTGIPLLRLPDGSKVGEVLEFAAAHHVGPPLYARRPGQGSVAEAGESVLWANGLRRPTGLRPKGRLAAGERKLNAPYLRLSGRRGIEAPKR